MSTFYIETKPYVVTTGNSGKKAVYRYRNNLFMRSADEARPDLLLLIRRGFESRFDVDEKVQAIKAKLDDVNTRMCENDMSFEVAKALARKMQKHPNLAVMTDWSIKRCIAAVVAKALHA